MSEPRCQHCLVPPEERCRYDLLPWLCDHAARSPSAAAHAVLRSRIANQSPNMVPMAAGTLTVPKRVRPNGLHFIGAATGDTVDCSSCAGTVRLKLFSCQVHTTTHWNRVQVVPGPGSA